MQNVRDKFPGWFAKGASSAVSDACNSLGIHCISEDVLCKDKDGNLVTRNLAYVASIPEFLQAVTSGHETSPNMVVSQDGGQASPLCFGQIYII